VKLLGVTLLVTREMQLPNSKPAAGLRQRIFLLASLMASLSSIPVTARAQQYGIIQHVLVNKGVGGALATGPDGAIWFAGYAGEVAPFTYFLGRIMPSGAITEYPVPGLPSAITTGSDGALWFTLYIGQQEAIGRMTTSGVFTEYLSRFGGVGPSGITSGPTGDLWFTGPAWLGSITTSGGMVEKYMAGEHPPEGPIVTGSDGNLWLAVYDGIARCTTQFVCTVYPVADVATSLAEGGDGAVWFTAGCPTFTSGCNIGRITTEGVITYYPVPNSAGATTLSSIVAGRDGALWFGLPGQIVRMNTQGQVVSAYPLPNYDAQPGSLAQAEGGIWFSETELDGSGRQIGFLAPLSASLAAEPSSFRPWDNITLTGSGFTPGETVNLLYSNDLGKTLPPTTIADSTGSFVVSGQAAPAPFGDGSVSAFGQSSGKLGVAGVVVNPRLILDPSSGSAGDTITASGAGFGINEIVYFYWKAPGADVATYMGTATADALGLLKGYILRPQGLGEQLVIATPYSNFRTAPPEPNGIGHAYFDVLAAAPSQ